MYKCIKCGVESDRHPTILLCKKCYQDDYNKRYYERNKNKIKNNTKKYYSENLESERERRKILREKREFDSKRTKVLLRDDYKCSVCGEKKESSKLTVHHKDRNGRGVTDKNNDLSNLITLCRSCHAKEHYKDLKSALKDKYKDKWSIKYDKCIECGTTERKHKAKGYCINCHARYLRNKKKEEDIV